MGLNLESINGMGTLEFFSKDFCRTGLEPAATVIPEGPTFSGYDYSNCIFFRIY